MFQQSLWALGAAACFSLMAVFVKLCGGYFGSMELVFYRSLVSVATIALFVYSTGGLSFKTRYIRGHIFRSVGGTLSVALWFYTLGKMPLGTNMTLIYTTPLFMAVNFIILAMMRHESPPWGVILAIFFGFAGVTCVLQPSFDGGYLLPAMICLFVAFIDLIVYWQIKELGDLKEPSWRIVFYFSLCGVIFGFVGAFVMHGGFKMPTLTSGLYLIGMGLCATLGQICTTRSYAYGNMLLSSCLGFSAIPFSAAISFIFFAEYISWEALIGMIMIVLAGLCATIYTKRVQAKEKREAAAKA